MKKSLLIAVTGAFAVAGLVVLLMGGNRRVERQEHRKPTEVQESNRPVAPRMDGGGPVPPRVGQRERPGDALVEELLGDGPPHPSGLPPLLPRNRESGESDMKYHYRTRILEMLEVALQAANVTRGQRREVMWALHDEAVLLDIAPRLGLRRRFGGDRKYRGRVPTMYEVFDSTDERLRRILTPDQYGAFRRRFQREILPLHVFELDPRVREWARSGRDPAGGAGPTTDGAASDGR